MQTQIRWNTKELTKDLPEDESGFYKAIGELLPEIEIPNKLYISCHMGDIFRIWNYHIRKSDWTETWNRKCSITLDNCNIK